MYISTMIFNQEKHQKHICMHTHTRHINHGNLTTHYMLSYHKIHGKM